MLSIRPALDIEANMADMTPFDTLVCTLVGDTGSNQLQSDLEQGLGILSPFMERC